MALPAEHVAVPLDTDPTVRTCGWAAGFQADRPFPGEAAVPSIYALLTRSARAHGAQPCLGWRGGDGAYVWWSYAEVAEMAAAVGRGLRALGVQRGDRVALYGRNCPSWALLQYAVLGIGATVVPIYDSLGPNIVEYVCGHAGVKLLCVAAENMGKWIATQEKGGVDAVKNVVVFGYDGIKDVVEPHVARVAVGDGVCTINDVLASGRAAKDVPDDLHDQDIDSLMVIMYTSGTTGDPKGVMLKNRAMIASVASAYAFFGKWGQNFTSSDVFLSYLPLSHIFAQQAEALFIGCGGRIGYYSGNIKLLLDDMETLKPTVFAGVPRVFARFQQRIEDNVEGASIIARTLFGWAYNRQLKAEENPGVVPRLGIWDTLVFNKVRAKLLPEARLVITGSAPMSGQTNDFLKVCLKCPVVQGYGLTETVGGMHCAIPGSSKSGTCGGPLPGVQVKLVDLPEMGYLNSDTPCPRGEICVKGDIVTSGYYNNEGATQSAFDADNWFHTGDVGQWNPDGSLQVIDRAKSLMKMAQGEYMSPEALEGEYVKAKLVGQIFVYASSLEATVLAVVVPDVPAAKAWGAANGGLTDLSAIAAAPAFKKEMLNQIEAMRVKSSFKKYEGIKDVVIEVSDLNDLGQGFTVENDLMTPSFKLKRPQITKKYKDQLLALYAAAKKK